VSWDYLAGENLPLSWKQRRHNGFAPPVDYQKDGSLVKPHVTIYFPHFRTRPTITIPKRGRRLPCFSFAMSFLV